MALWTTYHSVVDTVGGWVNTGNAVDNDTGTLATRKALGYTTMILDTPFAATPMGTITKVEHRLYGSLDDLGIPCKLKLSPRFIAGDGDLEDVTQNLGWSSWLDITLDTNAPGVWAWSDVTALGANVVYSWGSGPVPLAQCGVVEVRVTYTSGLVGKPEMAKIFEVDYRTRQTRDKISGAIPVFTGSPALKHQEKGIAVENATNASGLSYTTPLANGVYSVVMWAKHTETSPIANQYFFDCRYDGGIGYLLKSLDPAYAVTSGTMYVNNIASTTPIIDQYVCHMISGITLEASVINVGIRFSLASGALLPGGGMAYFAIYEGTFTASERASLYQDFLNAGGSISSPTILRPHIPVSTNDSQLSDPLFDDTGSNPWDLLVRSTWSGGETTLDSTLGAAYCDINNIGLDDFGDYVLSYEVVSYTGTANLILSSAGGLVSGTIPKTVGIHTLARASDGSADKFRFYMGTTGIIVLKDIRLSRKLSPILVHDYQQGNAADLSGNGNDGTPTLVDWGRDGAFFSNLSSINCGDVCDIGTGDYTAEVLISPTTIVNDVLISKGPGSTNGTFLWIVTGGGSKLWIKDSLGNVIANALNTGDVGLDNGKDHYLAFVLDRDSHCKIYVNGVDCASVAVDNTNDIDTAIDLLIGYYSGLGYEGAIRFARITRTALTEIQIQANWNKIARLVDTQVMDDNLLPDERTITAGGYIDA